MLMSTGDTTPLEAALDLAIGYLHQPAWFAWGPIRRIPPRRILV